MAGRNPKLDGEKARSAPALVDFERLNPASGTPVPPPLVRNNRDATFAWVTACKSLIPARHVAHIDLIALELFALAFARWRKCERACARASGDYAETPNGHRQISAARINANKAFNQVKDMGAKFGMTPVERVKTSESAQGDLPLGAPPPRDERPDAEENTVVDAAAIFRPREVRVVGRDEET